MKKLDQLYRLFCNYKKQNGKKIKKTSYYCVRNFIEFSKDECYTEYFDQEVFDDWCCRRISETKNTYLQRVQSMRQFLLFINREGYVQSTIPANPGGPYINRNVNVIKQTERPFMKTCMSDMLEDFILWIKAIDKYNVVDHGHLVRFNKEFFTRYPDAEKLTDDNVRFIFLQRTNENARSCNQRAKPVRNFIEYANWKYNLNINIPDELPCGHKKPRTPHAFTDKELIMFFNAIDNLQPYYFEDKDSLKFRKIQYATYFRLLFSTGMRTNEARNLKRSNVDFEQGVINIEHTKGYHQHIVALHPSMLEFLKLYEREMDKMLPNREPFFPEIDGKYHKISWQAEVFREIWHNISDEDARPYDLRSNYAVRNINSWNLGEPKWIDKFMYLSRSMGHVHLNSTAYYYHLVPMFRGKLEKQSGENLSKLLPDMDDFKEDE